MSEIEVGSAELAVPASWVRGGTSKCWIFQAADVDALPVTRDEFLLRAFGSPDLRQIDGIGGATSTTSKAIIVETRKPGQAADLVRYSVRAGQRRPPAGGMAAATAATAPPRWPCTRSSTNWSGSADDVTEFAMLNLTTGLVLQATVPTPGRDRPLAGRPAGPRRAVPGRAGRPGFHRADLVHPRNAAAHRAPGRSADGGRIGLRGHPDRRRRPGRGDPGRGDRTDRHRRRRRGRGEDAVLRRTAAQRRPRHGPTRQRPVRAQGRHHRPPATTTPS